MSDDEEDDGLFAAPQVDIQVKCTDQKILKADKSLHLKFKIKNYKDRRRNVAIPRILLVHQLPKGIDKWLRHSEEDLLLRHCSY